MFVLIAIIFFYNGAPMNVSLRHLAYFTRLVDRGSFTAAAASLSITQPALSSAIRELEARLAVRLLDRVGSAIHPTIFGRLFYEHALSICRDVKRTEDEIAQLRSGAKGQLDICVGPSAVGSPLALTLVGMKQESPDLEIHVRMAILPNAIERLRNAEFSLHIGTRIGDVEFEDIASEPIHALGFVIVGGPQHPLAKKRRIAAGDLLNFPWLFIGNFDAAVPQWRESFHREGLTPPNAAMDIRDVMLVQELLRHGPFLTALPSTIVAGDIRAKRLAAINPASFKWVRSLEAFYRKNRSLSPTVTNFLARLKGEYAKQRADLRAN